MTIRHTLFGLRPFPVLENILQDLLDVRVVACGPWLAQTGSGPGQLLLLLLVAGVSDRCAEGGRAERRCSARVSFCSAI